MPDREDAGEHRVGIVIKRYSNFAGAPIELNVETVSTINAIWTWNKSEATAEKSR